MVGSIDEEREERDVACPKVLKITQSDIVVALLSEEKKSESD